MCGSDQVRRLLRIGNLRQGYVELHPKREAPFRCGQEADSTPDRDVPNLDTLPTPHDAKSTFETGCVTHSKELFGVGAAPLPAQLLRRAKLDIQGPVICAPVTIRAAARDRSLRRVKNSCGVCPNSRHLHINHPFSYAVFVSV